MGLALIDSFLCEGVTMSESTDVSAPAAKSMPVWFIAGILGVFIGGAGGMLLAMFGYDYRMKQIKTPDLSALGAGGPSAFAPGAPGPGGGPGMGMPGMGGPGMGGPGMGGGGPSGKRNLTAFVGKVELLSRPNIQLTLDAEQQSKLAAELASLEQAEKMTDEEAQQHLESLEALLTPEQKEGLDAVSLPRRGGGAMGGGAMGGGAMGGGGPMGAPGGMPGGGDPEENPFAQETNQQRLHDLLARLQPPAEEKAVNAP
jgi:hypothetical protein